MIEDESFGNLSFRMDKGRIVSVHAFHASLTYDGVLEGGPPDIRQYLLESIPAEVRALMPPGEPLIILDSPSPLPRWRMIARLESSSGIGSNHPDLWSRLFLCWFRDSLEGSIDGMVQEALSGVDWESSAEDYDPMDY